MVCQKDSNLFLLNLTEMYCDRLISGFRALLVETLALYLCSYSRLIRWRVGLVLRRRRHCCRRGLELSLNIVHMKSQAV